MYNTERTIILYDDGQCCILKRVDPGMAPKNTHREHTFCNRSDVIKYFKCKSLDML